MSLAEYGEKRCSKCKNIKPLVEFYKNTRRPTGLSDWCVACESHYRKLRYWKNREQHLERNKQYKISNPEKAAAVRRKSWLKRMYSISVEEYEELLSLQDGRCAICLSEEDTLNKSRAFAVDHCHRTGRIRGLLCSSCNFALGFLQDDPLRVRNMLKYLGEHSAHG